MARNEDVSMSTILYHIREGLFSHACNAASDFTHPNHAVPQFLQAVCWLLQNDNQKALRTFESLCNQADVNLASIAAMLHIHKKARSVEKDTVQFLEGKLKSERKQGVARAYYYVGLFHFLTGRSDKGREYVERGLKMDAREEAAELLSLRGWMELAKGDFKKAVELFDQSLRNRKLPDALLGKARGLMLLAVGEEKPGSLLDVALELINQSVVLYKGFVPGLVEKGRFYMSQHDWEAMYDTCQRITELDEDNLQATEMMALYHLLFQVDYAQASQYVGQLLTSLKSYEASNHQLYHHYARLFSLLSDKNEDLLQQTIILQDTSIKLCGEDKATSKSAYLAGLGDIYVQKRRYEDALKCFNAAYDADDSNCTALIGRLRCYHLTNQNTHFENQMAFLLELKSVLGDSPELEFMRLIGKAGRGDVGVDKHFPNLKASVTSHLEKIKKSTYSSKFLIDLKVTFLLDVVEYLFTYIPCKPILKGQSVGGLLEFSSSILQCIKLHLPSHLTTNSLLAKTEYLKGDTASSIALLQHCIHHQPSSSQLHLLMAQAYLHDGNCKRAEECLDAALSHDFKVKEQPLYQLVKAGVLVGGGEEGAVEEATHLLTQALNHPSNKANNKRNGSGNERFLMYVMLVEVLRKKGDVTEAGRVLQAASEEFKDRGEMEGVLVEARVDLCVDKGMLEDAIKMLRGFKPVDDMYIQAQQRMAQIYLEHKNDSHMYITCYKDLYVKMPSGHTGVLLGDAYMKVHQPENAIETYETAMKKNSKDYQLAQKIGEALVKTHQYGKAVIYYECALKQKDKQSLRYDLARLLELLGQEEKAEKIIKQFVNAPDLDEDTETVIEMARCSHLMGKLKGGGGSLEWFEKAKSLQERVIMRVSVSNPENLAGHKKFAAKIAADLASVHLSQKRLSSAVKCLRGAVHLDPECAQHQLDLGMCLLTSSNLAECQQICDNLIQTGNDDGSATLLMCEVLLRGDRDGDAVMMIKKLFQEKGGTFALMARAIDIMRRCRRLDGSEAIMLQLSSATPNHNSDPGYNYCRGLIDWYKGDVKGAIGHLNVARAGVGWGVKALSVMVDICTNPDRETIGGGVFVKEEDSEYLKKKKVGLETATRFLKDLKPIACDDNYLLQLNTIMMLSSRSEGINEALKNFTEALQSDEENVVYLYGSAVAQCLLGQLAKAKPLLKKICKMEWNLQDAKYLEEAWLLYADILIQKDSKDTAIEILNKCLKYNKSCTKALEYQAHIREASSQHEEAATHYQTAWSLNHNPAIGYKLAFNLLQVNDFTKCIDVCHQVLQNHPSYPKIKKEILDKARSLIKVASW